ncbi:hypothetical protein CALVIDRAFT_368320 [Calocera viscosa TUFC12733]|uniref:Uncharacterized protein n=1 Tax=Calocera viscosa (strain TUFC12733) TaxID=1330018 RepID=A0A167GZ48_CALVF|nr:hypothetical protein CALVIDRAFT_368320 [Calocera viscosa TUFC12733]
MTWWPRQRHICGWYFLPMEKKAGSLDHFKRRPFCIPASCCAWRSFTVLSRLANMFFRIVSSSTRSSSGFTVLFSYARFSSGFTILFFPRRCRTGPCGLKLLAAGIHGFQLATCSSSKSIASSPLLAFASRSRATASDSASPLINTAVFRSVCVGIVPSSCTAYSSWRIRFGWCRAVSSLFSSGTSARSRMSISASSRHASQLCRSTAKPKKCAAFSSSGCVSQLQPLRTPIVPRPFQSISTIFFGRV